MSTPARTRRLPRPTARLLALVALAALAATVVFAAPAGAAESKKKNCARAVVNDWYGDGQVDKVFEPHCYKEAIRSLPVDVKDYSNAEEDILRALAYAKKGLPDPGDAGSKGGGSKGNATDPPPPHTPVGTGGEDDPSETTGEGETMAGPDIDTSGSSSIPIPLLVLGGLAVLLLAAGGAGYVNRRFRGGNTDA